MTSPASSAPSLPGEAVAPQDRGERLLGEYQEVESALRVRGIRHFIAVFGSTRLPQENRFCHMARELGAIVAREARRAGDGAALVTGGGPGVMAAANRGAFEAGGASVGMNIMLPAPQAANPWITPGLGFSFRYFALRKLHFMLRARALVAFPGGFGTLDELFETLMLVQTAKVPPLPVVLAGEAHWRRAIDLPYLVESGVLTDEDRRLFCYADSASAIWDAIAGWYRVRGEAVFPAEP